MRSILKKQTGDTIVEVLISIGVVSLVLVITYSLATRSSLTIRAAQERSEALKYTESQMERLKNYLVTGTPASINGKCLPASAPTTPAAAPCVEGPDNRYEMTINQGGSGDLFIVNTVWDRVGGEPGQRQTLNLTYKIP